MAKKKISTSLVNSDDAKLPTTKKVKKKSGKVDDLSPKAKNKDSVTENIKSRSSKAVKDAGLGKIVRVPLNPNLKK